MGHAGIGGAVQFDALGLQHPVGGPAIAVIALAGGVGGLVDGRALAAEKLDALGIAMALGIEKLVGRFGEVALKGIDLQFELGTLVNIAAPVDVDVALGGDGVVGQGVLRLVGADDGVAPAQLHMAFQAGADVGLALKVIGLHIGGQLATGFWGECFLQPGAGFELGRGQGSIPSAGLGGQGSGRCASHGGAAQVAAHRTLRRLGAWTNKHGGENGEQRWEAIVEAAGLRPGRKVGL